MSHSALRVPDSLLARAGKAAEQDHTSINQFFVVASAEKLASLESERLLMAPACRAGQSQGRPRQTGSGQRPRDNACGRSHEASCSSTVTCEVGTKPILAWGSIEECAIRHVFPRLFNAGAMERLPWPSAIPPAICTCSRCSTWVASCRGVVGQAVIEAVSRPIVSCPDPRCHRRAWRQARCWRRRAGSAAAGGAAHYGPRAHTCGSRPRARA